MRVPDLGGTWTFEAESTYENRSVTAVVQIHQTWRSMLIQLEADHSRSSSLVGSLLTSSPGEFVLNYEFMNTPKLGAPDTMHAHRGSAEIRFACRQPIASGSGEYYTGRDRRNLGKLTASRI